jgi:hypothetical protein
LSDKLVERLRACPEWEIQEGHARMSVQHCAAHRIEELEQALREAEAKIKRLEWLVYGPPEQAVPEDVLKERLRRQALGMQNVYGTTSAAPERQ